MKILLLVLQMSMEVLTYTQEPCEINRSVQYDVFKTIVQIQVFYCFFNIRDDFQCENYHYAKTIVEDSAVIRDCIYKMNLNLLPHSRARLDIDSEQGKVRVCVSEAEVNLLENKMVFAGNKQCDYSKGYYKDEDINSYIIWIPDTCYNLRYIYSGSFDVYRAKASKNMYIRHTPWSLQIKETFTLCNRVMSKTNYDGVVVVGNDNQHNNITQSTTLVHYQSTLDEECIVTTKNDTMELAKLWYIYKYVIDVTVYRCIFDGDGSCATLELDEYPTTNKSFLNLCNTFCETCKNVQICQQTLKVDLQQNTVQGISSDCKYSDGECRPFNAFWYNSDNCGAIQKIEGTYKEDCNDTNRVIKNFNSTQLILSAEGELCGENVWFTDRYGIVASEQELKFVQKIQVHFKKKVQNRTKEMYLTNKNIDAFERNVIDNKAFFNCLLLFVIVCVVWYICSVIINFCTLKKIGKMKTSKSRTYLLNCVSQSLTNRYIFLVSSESEKEEIVVMSKLQESDMYESIDDKF